MEQAPERHDGPILCMECDRPTARVYTFHHHDTVRSPGSFDLLLCARCAHRLYTDLADYNEWLAVERVVPPPAWVLTLIDKARELTAPTS